MAELFVEVFSEEIPARMQARAAEDFSRLVGQALEVVGPKNLRTFWGPRRIALAADVELMTATTTHLERGPRITAPEQALAGFLRKHGASREALREEGDFWVLEKISKGDFASVLIASVMPALLRRFPWPKSMRWGGTSGFTWVRPLRRIVCLLDGAVVPFGLAVEGDDGHGLASGCETEGHRFHAPGPVAVSGCADWQTALASRHVIVSADERRRLIAAGVGALAASRGLTVVDDPGLLDEVSGLVEWPVPLLGRIDDAFMDLPPEVMQVSMRVNQRYFALREADGRPAPWFAFASNIAAPDGGAAIVAGNERVLRARFSDARHFWDVDRKIRLADRVAALDGVVFHAELGTQGARARRIARLAGVIAAFVGADTGLAERAGLLAKADLTTGMVGEFPELQGVMGGYYARHDGEASEMAAAVRDHYLPKGAGDAVPVEPVSIAVALADKLDQLSSFFAIGQKPTGSGDPFALRRAALGVIRILRENRLRLPLMRVLAGTQVARDVLDFIVDRLRVQLRAEGERHDVLAAVFAAGGDDDLVRALARTEAVAGLLGSADGGNLLAAYKRAANILRIEDRKDGPHEGPAEAALFREDAERGLAEKLDATRRADALIAEERYVEAMNGMASLRPALDAFFENVTVNAEDPGIRRNRLRLLSQFRATMNQVADFSTIES